MADAKRRFSSQRVPRVLQFALFVTAMLWVAAARAIAVRAAGGIATRFHMELQQTLLESLFLLFLAVVGFRCLDWIATRRAANEPVLELPRRPSSGAEWGTGAAIGWGLCLAAVFPVLLAGHFHASFNRGAGVPAGVLTAVATLLTICLAEEAIFRGYPFKRLCLAFSPAWAVLLVSILFAAVLIGFDFPTNGWTAWFNLVLLGFLLAMARLRTGALWMGWGLHFSFRMVMAVVFGLPIAGRNDFVSIFDSSSGGPVLLYGGGFGLDAALFTGIALIAGMAVLYRTSSEWAYLYTRPELVSAGYEVTVAPPAAHVAMERSPERSTGAAPPPLVQILSATPEGMFVTPASPPRQQD